MQRAADVYYKWEAVVATHSAEAYKQPYLIASEQGHLTMAGLYEF